MSSHRSVGSTALLPFRHVGVEAGATERLDVGQHNGLDIRSATIGVVRVEILLRQVEGSTNCSSKHTTCSPTSNW